MAAKYDRYSEYCLKIEKLEKNLITQLKERENVVKSGEKPGSVIS
jgi:hypothetical protein